MPAEDRITFRPGPLMEHLVVRAVNMSPDLVAKRDLHRYYALLSMALPKFTVNEALLLCDICNGWAIGESDWKYLPHEVEDGIALSGLDQKWEVDGPALVKKLSGLTLAERLATVDAIERVWGAWKTAPDQEREIALREEGLIG